MRVFARYNRAVEPVAYRGKLCLQHSAIGEFTETNSPIGGAYDQRTERTFRPGNNDAIGVATSARSLAECANESVPKAAMGIVAIPENDFVQVCPTSNLC